MAWRDVENIFMYELMGQKMIGIKLRDEKAFLDRQNGMKRKLMTVNSNISMRRLVLLKVVSLCHWINCIL
ncbi:hypothetical protein M1D71_05150 [Paenibacillus sp. Z3-2]